MATSVNDLVRAIKNKAETVEVRCDAMGVLWTYRVVEGDHPLADEDLATYAAERIQTARATSPGRTYRGLIAMTNADGQILRWERNVILKYSVWRPSFANDDEYNRVVEATRLATADWQGLCGVRFEHVRDRDADPALKPGGDVFPIVRSPGGGSLIAIAFFPTTARERHVVAIYDGFFEPSPVFDPTGVLRHELGHVLGFRHEHIAPEAPHIFAQEDIANIVQLTSYDPKSVMHYLGPNVGNPALTFTDLDRLGAKKVYGEPDSAFDFYPKP